MDRDEDLNTTGWIISFDIAVDGDHSLDRCRYRPIALNNRYQMLSYQLAQHWPNAREDPRRRWCQPSRRALYMAQQYGLEQRNETNYSCTSDGFELG